jgi:dipeptidyl aminopeptidase/acylaminoacyl peptidase
MLYTAFTRNGRTLATLGGSHGIQLWDPTTGRELRRLGEVGDGILSMQLSRDSQTLFSGERNGTLRAWDVAAWKASYRLSRKDLGAMPLLAAISPDTRMLAMIPSGRSVVLIDATTGETIRTLPRADASLYGAAFSPDGRRLVYWSGEPKVHVWDVAADKELQQFSFRDAPFHPGGPVPVPAAGGAPEVYFKASLAPDGRLIVFGTPNHLVAVHGMASGQVVRRLENLPDGVGVVVFSPDDRALAWAGDRDPTVHVVDLATGQERQQFSGHKGPVDSLTFSPDGKRLVTGSADATALVWDLTGRLATEGNWGGPLGPNELEACWADLAEQDAARANRSIHRLASAPAEAVPFLTKRLRPAAAADETHLARLVADLDSEQFAVREKAAKGLEKLGELAVGALRQELAGQPSAEVRRRLEALLDKAARIRWNLSGDRLRVLRAIEVLEQTATADARALLAKFADGAPETWLTREAKASLQRLATLLQDRGP